jgi:xanthine dehydrogenase accessory factor
MNLYGDLLNALENSENQLVITRLPSSAGSLDRDFNRVRISAASFLKSAEGTGRMAKEEGIEETSLDKGIEETDLDKGIEEIDLDKSIEETAICNAINETAIRTAALEVLKSGKPKIFPGEGEERILIEPFFLEERLIILGGGHIALPLAEFAARTGFLVTVVDDRPSFANKARFPSARQVICNGFDRALEQLKLTSNDYIVIITRGHRHDTECLKFILSQPETRYLGMIGSRRRVGAVKDMLAEEGFDKDRLDRICTPIGLSIGAVTPEEISISILAELIRRKRLEISESTNINHSDLDMKVIELLAKRGSEPVCIVTVIRTKGSVPRGTGAKMLVYPTGQVAGSIGGGCSEAEVIHNAVSMIGSRRFQIQTIDMTGDVAESEGMVCGGIMEVLIEDGI